MTKINLLSADVYNRIAAGEVVDRPYSVVKELVENAVDAGATQIAVEIEGGGKRRVRVTDNGCGIAKDDLPRAFAPHATSKLKSADDLFAVSTLGFRGEAIASVAAVSRMCILSREEGEDAFSLACEGGVMGTVVPAAGARGTVVTVDDLFFNVPARRKFLKSDTQEEADITAVMARFLLSRPHISFTYSADGKTKFRSFGDGLAAALAAVYGAGILENCMEICAEKHGIRLSGFLGKRNFYKPNRTWQSLFVNGRCVVNQTVGAAVANAYASYLMKRQYPFYVLFLEIPPEAVDVNVHPNKADVRFADNQVVYGCVYSIVSAVLDGNSRALEYLVGVREAGPREEISRADVPAETALAAGAGEADAAPHAPCPDVRQMTYEAAKAQLKFDVTMPSAEPHLLEREAPRLEVRAPSAAERMQEDAFAENRRFLLEAETKAQRDRIDPDTLIYKGELFQTYLIYEAGDRAYLIDQHAAHERILFDRLKEKIGRRAVCSQPMLVPYVATFNAQEFVFMQKNAPLLREMGFEIDEFGENSMRVSAVPADLTELDPAAFFAEVLSSMESLRGIRLSELLQDRLATCACKAAVKGGKRLDTAEARALIGQMGGDMQLKCPHGRPAVVTLKKSDLEKMFKRIV